MGGGGGGSVVKRTLLCTRRGGIQYNHHRCRPFHLGTIVNERILPKKGIMLPFKSINQYINTSLP